MKGFSGELRDGREVFIPHWPVDVALENLGKAGELLGVANIITIAEFNIPAAIMAIAQSKNPEGAAALVRHFVCSARIEGKKTSKSEYDEVYTGNLAQIPEIFTMVVHAQYNDFFSSGLVKEVSQDD